MNIGNLVGNKYDYKSTTFHRHLNDDPLNGILASGYIPKNTKSGSHFDYMAKTYHGLLIISGSGTYKDDTCEIPVSTGDFIQRLPNVKHTTTIADDNYAELYVILGKSLYDDLLPLNVINNNSPVLHPGIDYETIQALLHLQDQLGYVDHLELPLLVPQLISYLARITYLSKNNQHTTIEKNILSIATSYIHENIIHRITVEDVAAHVNMGYEKFRKLFTTHYNISPGNYIIHVRINKSQRLLSQSGLSIKEIAYQLGYVDSYTFSKQFKKITGRTPSDFQNIFSNI